jgi:hypothetical protein
MIGFKTVAGDKLAVVLVVLILLSLPPLADFKAITFTKPLICSPPARLKEIIFKPYIQKFFENIAMNTNNLYPQEQTVVRIWYNPIKKINLTILLCYDNMVKKTELSTITAAIAT